MLTQDEIEKEALTILDRLPTLTEYDKEVTGLLAEEGTHAILLRVSGPGLAHLLVKGIVTERWGKKRRWVLVKDEVYPDFTVINKAPPELGGRFSNPIRAFEAVDAYLSKENCE